MGLHLSCFLLFTSPVVAGEILQVVQHCQRQVKAQGSKRVACQRPIPARSTIVITQSSDSKERCACESQHRKCRASRRGSQLQAS